MGQSQQRLGSIPKTWADEQPEKTAVVQGELRASYVTLARDVRALTSSLRMRGLTRGEKVIAALPNGYEMFVLFFAVARLGAVLVPCHPSIRPEDLLQRLRQLDPAWAVVASEECATALCHELPRTQVIGVGCCSEVRFSDLLRGSVEEGIDEGSPNDPFLIVFTSGTTRQPKGVVLTQDNLLTAATRLGERLDSRESDVTLIPLPIAHMYGLVAGILIPTIFGGTTVLMSKHDSHEVLRLIQEERVTVRHGVPTMYVREIDHLHSSTRPYCLSSLRVAMAAGAFVPSGLIERIEAVFGVPLVVGYGSTETVNISATSPYDPAHFRHTSVGRLAGADDVRIMGPDDREVARGMPGELWSKGPGTMLGYFEMPEETSEAVVDGWWRSGDLATLDHSGYIRIIGRLKDVIIRAGNNIAPAEIESALSLHPHVQDSCVVGVDDEEYGERVVAVVQWDSGIPWDVELLRGYVKGHVSRFKVPDYFLRWGELPRVEFGKVNRRELQLQVMACLRSER